MNVSNQRDDKPDPAKGHADRTRDNKTPPTSKSRQPEDKPPSDGQVIAELGDELGGPA